MSITVQGLLISKASENRSRRHLCLFAGFISVLFVIFLEKYTWSKTGFQTDIDIQPSEQVSWALQSARGFQELPPLLWPHGEETQPYFLSPVLQVPNDIYRRRTHYNLTDIVSMYVQSQVKEKLILLYDMPKWHRLETRHENSLKNCPVKNCKLTENKNGLHQADGVVFYTLSIHHNKPPPKLPNQMWIFFAHEPQWNFPRWNDMFNWTMTFRFDSDIVCPYYVLLPKLHPDLRNFTSIAEKRSSVVMWLVSNCSTRSKREVYVRELHKYIKVDIYGRCGTRKCPRFWNGNCNQLQNENYKFYLAFENSLCDDYITEKLFHCYKLDIVPVVRGGASYGQLLPRGTYINVADFSSPRKLAAYLKYLDDNDAAYAEILQRKSQFTITKSESTFESSLCDICVKLHNLDMFSNTYYDINKWWYTNSCSHPMDLGPYS